MATRIDGKVISAQIREEIKEATAAFVAERGYAPGLAVVIVGEDPASQVYVRNKALACEQVGFYSEVHRLPAQTKQEELNALVDRMNADEKIHGILVQLPLPKHLDETEVLLRIDPKKDVDAFHPYNVGKIMIGDYDFLPCTPAGVMEMLKFEGIDPAGKHAVVIGRSNIVGKPMAMLLTNRSGTVTVCHSKTNNLIDFTKNADISKKGNEYTLKFTDQTAKQYIFDCFDLSNAIMPEQAVSNKEFKEALLAVKDFCDNIPVFGQDGLVMKLKKNS